MSAASRRPLLLHPAVKPLVFLAALGPLAWLVTAAVLTRATSRRANGPRTAAWLSLASFAVLTGSILWGLFGATRHGAPPVVPAARHEAAP